MKNLITLIVLASTAFCLAQDKPTTQPANSGMNMGGMDAAAMNDMQKMMTPGPGQEYFKKLVGKYKTTTKVWPGPGAPEMTSEGEATWSLLMDGKYAKQETTGTSMGQPFKGMSLVGYDNLSGEYTNIWIDTMSTAMMITHGKVAADGKTITLTGEMSNQKVREVVTSISDDESKYEMFMVFPDGNEFKMVEVVSKRVK